MNDGLPLHRFTLALAVLLLSLYFWGNSQPEAVGLIPAPWEPDVILSEGELADMLRTD